jgi:hypothetical protein
LNETAHPKASRKSGKTLAYPRVFTQPRSVTVYNKDGYLQPNPRNVYSVNSLTAKRGADGIVTIQFGGCDDKVENCVPITDGWNYTVRLFRPRREILNNTWKFANAQPVIVK